MKPGEKVFVYGTLKQGHGANSYMQGRAKFLADTRISGELYNLGWFPGFKLTGKSTEPGVPVPFTSEGPTVQGELYEIEAEDLPKMLDSYEGYPHLYDRTRVETELGEPAWVYCYRGNYDEKQRILSGKWE